MNNLIKFFESLEDEIGDVGDFENPGKFENEREQAIERLTQADCIDEREATFLQIAPMSLLIKAMDLYYGGRYPAIGSLICNAMPQELLEAFEDLGDVGDFENPA